MAKTETLRIRVEPSLKSSVEEILAMLGLTASEAITLFYKQIKLQKGLPFEVKIPNAATRKALRDSLAGENRNYYKSFEELEKKLF